MARRSSFWSIRHLSRLSATLGRGQCGGFPFKSASSFLVDGAREASRADYVCAVWHD